MNKKSITVVAGIMVLALVFTLGCRTPGNDSRWGWKAKRPKKMQEVFSHDVHKAVLRREGFECFACHPMAVKIKEEEKAAEMIRASNETFFPGKETCHFCHFKPKAESIAPEKCGICHMNTRDIRPANHNFDWITRHAVFSKTDAGSCENCHTPRFCEDCHKKRELTTRRVHDRNFRFVHPIEARANPSKCGSCHQLKSFCDKCHAEGGFER